MFNSIKSTLCGIVMMVLLTQSVSVSEAQMSESETTQYAPSGTFLFVSLNMERILEQIDLNQSVLKKFRARKNFSSTDLTETQRVLMLLTESVADEPDEMDIPGVLIQRFKSDIDKSAFLTKMEGQSFGGLEFEKIEYGDHEFMQGKLNSPDGVMVVGGTPAYLFTQSDIVASSNDQLIRQMIDTHQDDTVGKEFLANIDTQAEIHFLMEDGKKLAALPAFRFMTEFMNVPGFDIPELINSIERVEVVADTEQMTPVQGTLEMTTEKAAEEAEDLIKALLQAAPGVLMMGKGELDAAIERDDKQIAGMVEPLKELIQLGEKAVAEIEVSRDGSQVNIELGSIDGLDKLANNMVIAIANQQMIIEEIMIEFGEGPGEVLRGIELDDGPSDK